MARKRNPRRVLLEQLRGMKRRLDRAVSVWSVESTVFVPTVEVRRCDPRHYRHLPIGPDGLVEVEIHNGTWRKREASEYPENSKDDWARVCHALDGLIAEARHARNEAYGHWKRLHDAA